jgi:putative ABC transport system substrate-binding protein
MAIHIRRREFIFTLGGAAAWPLVARAQQGERMRRIGVLMYWGADDAEGQARLAAFAQTLKQLGWSEGHNLRIDTRWATTEDILRRHAAELVALAPDVLVAASGTATVAPLMQATRTVPIVFVITIDPVGAGFVASLAKPGGNATGFMAYEYSMSGKWLELLKEIAPRVTRAAVLRDPAVASGIGQFGAVQIVAPSFGVELIPGPTAGPRARACSRALSGRQAYDDQRRLRRLEGRARAAVEDRAAKIRRRDRAWRRWLPADLSNDSLVLPGCF